MDGDAEAEAGRRGAGPLVAVQTRIRRIVDAPRFQRTIAVLIGINAVFLGLETSPAAMAAAGPLIRAADQAMLAAFTFEIAARLFAHGLRFFRDPWSVFDFVVVGIALVPATAGFSVLRALRVLRVLRLVSAVPRMRLVVQALLGAIPGIGSILALLSLIFYVAAVMATKLFGAGFPEWFGSIPRSLYSLFQIMTLESWSMGIVRPVMAVYGYAWAFFLPFILITTFTVLNLFIAVVVSAMQAEHTAAAEADQKEAHGERQTILEEIRTIRAELAALRAGIERAGPEPASGEADGRRR